MERRFLVAALALVAVLGVAAILLLLRSPGRGGTVRVPTEDAPAVAPRMEPAELREPVRRSKAEPEPVAEVETTTAELAPEDADDSWLVPTPPGVVEVQVLADRAPVRGALVELLPEAAGSLQYGEPIDVFGQPLDPSLCLRATTDAQGLVRWVDLEPGRPELRVTLPDGAQLLRYAELWKDQPDARVVVRFGKAAVRGTVYDERGEPVAGAHVWLRQTPNGGSNDTNRWTVSREDGAFLFDRLTEGFSLLADATPGPGRRARFTLGENEEREVDLGSAQGVASWRGRLRLASGAPLSESLTFELDEVDGRAWTEELYCGDEGIFEVVLPPGRYRVPLRAYDGPIELGSVEVGEDDLTQDLTLPSACLRIDIVRPGVDGSSSNVEVQILRAHLELEPRHRFSSRGNRLFVAGIPPGPYGIRIQGHRITGHGDDPLPLVIAPGQELVELRIEATPTPSPR